jgi:hypothetical protein
MGSFCQLDQAKSLREISTGLKSSLGKLSHTCEAVLFHRMGVRKAPVHSTLAYANEHRDWRIYKLNTVGLYRITHRSSPIKRSHLRGFMLLNIARIVFDA